MQNVAPGPCRSKNAALGPNSLKHRCRCRRRRQRLAAGATKPQDRDGLSFPRLFPSQRPRHLEGDCTERSCCSAPHLPHHRFHRWWRTIAEGTKTHRKRSAHLTEMRWCVFGPGPEKGLVDRPGRRRWKWTRRAGFAARLEHLSSRWCLTAWRRARAAMPCGQLQGHRFFGRWSQLLSDGLHDQSMPTVDKNNSRQRGGLSGIFRRSNFLKAIIVSHPDIFVWFVYSGAPTGTSRHRPASYSYRTRFKVP